MVASRPAWSRLASVSTETRFRNPREKLRPRGYARGAGAGVEGMTACPFLSMHNLANDAVKRPLRIGVMLDTLVVPAWIELILQQIAERDFLDLSLVVLNADVEEPRSLPRRLWEGRSKLLYRLYERIDAAVYSGSHDAFDQVEASAVEGVPMVEARPLTPSDYEHRFDDKTLERIREADLDVVLRFGFRIIRGEILGVARHGVWSFHHGDSRQYRGGPSFFWEMYEGNPVTGTTLQILTNDLDAGRIIYRSYSATDPVSLRRGRNRPFLKSANFVVRRMTDLHQHGFGYIEGLDTYREPAASRARIYKTPTNREMGRFLARTGMAILRRRLWRLALREEWFVAYRQVSEPRGELDEGPPFTRLEHPPRRSFADPFVVSSGNRSFIFFEDFDFASKRGSISYVSLNGTGRVTSPAPALRRPYHLSYPFLFEHDGERYMIPETAANRRIELYRATNFPDEWQLERVLLEDIEAVDATLFRHDGHLWLFANVSDSGGPTVDELFLFRADSLDGEWIPHPMNPVVSDVRRARPAGRLFERDGRLIRPSQDCSWRYGSAVVLNEVTVLTPDRYEEATLGRIDPDWGKGNLGSHTYNFDGRIEVVDGLAGRRRR
jgi:hypothetical protein